MNRCICSTRNEQKPAHVSPEDLATCLLGQQEAMRREYEILRPECFLAVYEHLVACAERDRAFMCCRVKCRDRKFAEVLNTKRSDIDVVGS